MGNKYGAFWNLVVYEGCFLFDLRLFEDQSWTYGESYCKEGYAIAKSANILW